MITYKPGKLDILSKIDNANLGEKKVDYVNYDFSYIKKLTKKLTIKKSL